MENSNEQLLDHIARISKELRKLKKDIKNNDFGKFEHRLYWAMRGADPQKSICTTHNRKITQNDLGEFVCEDCVDEDKMLDLDTFDENLWFDVDNEPLVKIYKIKYGDKAPEV